MTTQDLVLVGVLSWLVTACGGAVKSESSAATTSPETPPPASADATVADAGVTVSSSACVAGGTCTNEVRCRPCSDRCDPRCQELSCVQGTWRGNGSDPRPDPSCFDAGPRSCVMPPVDTSSCTTSADCAIAFKGCWCGKRPVFGVNKLHVAVVQQCENDLELGCLDDCDREAGYSFSGGTTTNRQSLVPYCDTQPESGVCGVQVSN